MTAATSAPRVNHGWTVFAHPLFTSQLEALIQQVEALRQNDPVGYVKKNAAKRLAAIARLAFDVIPQDPTRAEYRQGGTLGDDRPTRLRRQRRCLPCFSQDAGEWPSARRLEPAARGGSARRTTTTGSAALAAECGLEISSWIAGGERADRPRSKRHGRAGAMLAAVDQENRSEHS